MPSSVTFPWAVCCSVNERLGPAGDKLRLTRRYRKCLEDASFIAGAHGPPEPTEYDVRVRLRIWWPDARNRDLDGWIKIPLDALEGVAYHDDGQIVDLRVTDEGIDREEPRIEATVTVD